MPFEYNHADLLNPVLEAMHELGGSANVGEIENRVIPILGLTEEEINDIHRGSTTKLTYRLAWARNYLKHFGLLENSSRGVWALTPQGTQARSVDPAKVVRTVVGQFRRNRENTVEAETENGVVTTWQEELLKVLQGMPPDRFEILAQRLLRELGFSEVEVMGRVGDGGIDGKGILTIGGVLGFHVVFQCKRFSGVVGAAYIRDFRGAKIGRADKGLFITTGVFTADAKREALREGAPPIDLLDGMQLAEKLKELGLGIEVRTVERVKVLREWFDEGI